MTACGCALMPFILLLQMLLQIFQIGNSYWMALATPVPESVVPRVESVKLLIVCVPSGLHLLSQRFSLLRYMKNCIGRLGAFLVHYFLQKHYKNMQIVRSLIQVSLHHS